MIIGSDGDETTGIVCELEDALNFHGIVTEVGSILLLVRIGTVGGIVNPISPVVELSGV